jgi:hypothetical protein
LNLAVGFILLLLLAGFIGLAIYAFRQKRQLDTAFERLSALTGNDESAWDREPEMVLTLRVIDPIGVAKRESKSARVVADHLPVTVRKRVYEQVMREMGEELLARGIETEMNVEYR